MTRHWLALGLVVTLTSMGSAARAQQPAASGRAVELGARVGFGLPFGNEGRIGGAAVDAKLSDDVVYKIIETLEANKAELVTIQPALREFSAAALYKKYDLPYHPGALKYFKDKNITAK